MKDINRYTKSNILNFIEENEYQKIKNILHKKDDYYTKKEILKFNAIFNATAKKNYKKI